MDNEINEPGHVNNSVDGINATVERYLNEQMELVGKLASNNTTKIRILPGASKYISNKISDKCIHILNNK